MTVLYLVLGLAAAAIGGEFFIKGSVGVAQWLRMPARLIGCTVAAFATSSPELAVTIKSSLAGVPNIALGDALGSNVINIGLVLGLALIIKPIPVKDKSFTSDFWVALLATFVIAFMARDVEFDRVEAAVLMVMFFAWLGHTVWKARRDSQKNPQDAVPHTVKQLVILAAFVVVGLGLLVAAGHFIVLAAKDIGALLGWSQFIVGATLVAFGTSFPELATTLIAQWRGHDDIGLGNIIGSNIFNALFIVAVAAFIHPIIFSFDSIALALLFGVILMAAAMPFGKTKVLSRRRGVFLVALYVIYLACLIGRG